MHPTLTLKSLQLLLACTQLVRVHWCWPHWPRDTFCQHLHITFAVCMAGISLPSETVTSNALFKHLTSIYVASATMHISIKSCPDWNLAATWLTPCPNLIFAYPVPALHLVLTCACDILMPANPPAQAALLTSSLHLTWTSPDPSKA